MNSPEMRKRIWVCILGVAICSLSVGFFKTAAFGVDPFQTFMAGLDMLIPISFGTLYVIANAVLLLFALFADRHYISLGTLMNLFLTGYIVQFSYSILHSIFPNPSMVIRLICLVIGINMMCLASAFYFAADLGVSTYDAVALIITGTWKIGQFKYVRIMTDFVCVAVGVALYLIAGGEPGKVVTIAGFGTIITAFFMGPLIDFYRRKIVVPFMS